MLDSLIINSFVRVEEGTSTSDLADINFHQFGNAICLRK